MSNKKVFVYYRVSSHTQAIQSQKDDLLGYVNSRSDWEIVDEFQDEAISGDSFSKRPAYQEMIKRAMKGEVDLICIWSLSRLGRSLAHIVSQTHDLREKANVGIYAHCEKLDTSDDSIAGKITLACLSALNECNLRIIRDSVRTGVKRKLAEYRESGKHWGRPVLGISLTQLEDLRYRRNFSIRQCARALQCSPATVVRRLDQLKTFQKSVNDKDTYTKS